jgi:hypothetical protein
MMRLQTRTVVVVIVVAALLVLVASFGVGSNPNPLAGKAESRTTNASVGVGVLTAGVGSVILAAIITGVSAWNARKRELLGLLRLLYVEIETNRGEAELLLKAKNLKAGPWTDTVYKDDTWNNTVYKYDTWKEVRSRLSQLLPDTDHFHQLVAYYARNDAQERGIFHTIVRGASFSSPGDPQAKLMSELLEKQEGLAVDALDMILEYIVDPPIGRESVEDAKRKMEQLQRELDAEKDRRGEEEQ